MKILREKTDYSSAGYNVPLHDYLVTDCKTKLIAFRRADCDQWQKFDKPRNFSRTRRSFTTLKEEMPANFVAPFAKDPRSFQSLELFYEH